MKTLSSRELREAFLGFFESRQHAVVASSPLVPGNDPTLLFTNAGMVQFKDLFLGDETRDYVRATTSQRCVRAGGKHNDLENVGYTARHLTFFEMLGNFSFGDYFKREAIQFAWAFVTEALEIEPERLWVTVYKDDDEAADIWINEIGVPASRLSRLGEKDNFWQMGDTGPCGPCSEIFFDHGPDVAGGPPGSPDEDGDRYVEIWNLVFMQFDRDASGTLTPLPKPSVDTGMGLERVSAVLQGVHTIYDTDMFQRLIKAVASAVGVACSDAASLRVIADHIRACAFLITDGVLPSNEGRGYVLRRIIRRAVRHGYMLGQQQPFFHKLVSPLIAEMGEAYPELAQAGAHAERVLEQEELRFAQTIEQGMAMLASAIDSLDGDQLDGETVFKLYDTYGFPMDLTADIARERQLTIDEAGFNAAMQAQRERAQAASKFGAASGAAIKSDTVTHFSGYSDVSGQSVVTGLFKQGAPVEQIADGEEAVVVLQDTPFYAESGGQIGDIGRLVGDSATFAVTDTQKGGKAHLHIGILAQGSLSVGDTLTAQIDVAHRNAVRLNHSATHLLHAALRDILGTHVTQKGSLVDAEKLRFDFSHYEVIDNATLRAIESRVNQEIRANHPAQTREMPYDDAVDAGAIALFGEKYDSDVRVLQMGEFSMELCGGTHVSRTGDIGLFKIRSEGGVASGVRRIEAVTGDRALALVSERESSLSAVSELVRAPREEAVHKVQQLIARNKTLEKELTDVRRQLATGGATDLASQAIDVNDVKLLSARIDGADAKSLRDAVDQMRDKLGARSVVVLGVEDNGKVRLAAGVSKQLLDIIKAGDLVRHVAEGVGGKGGGRPDFAQAGGTQPENLDKSLASVENWLHAKLSE